MLVLLKRNWFVGGRRFRRLPSGTAVPDALRDKLPKDAEILDKPVEIVEEKEPFTLSELSKKINPPGEPGAKQK